MQTAIDTRFRYNVNLSYKPVNTQHFTFHDTLGARWARARASVCVCASAVRIDKFNFHLKTHLKLLVAMRYLSYMSATYFTLLLSMRTALGLPKAMRMSLISCDPNWTYCRDSIDIICKSFACHFNCAGVCVHSRTLQLFLDLNRQDDIITIAMNWDSAWHFSDNNNKIGADFNSTDLKRETMHFMEIKTRKISLAFIRIEIRQKSRLHFNRIEHGWD